MIFQWRPPLSRILRQKVKLWLQWRREHWRVVGGSKHTRWSNLSKMNPLKNYQERVKATIPDEIRACAWDNVHKIGIFQEQKSTDKTRKGDNSSSNWRLYKLTLLKDWNPTLCWLSSFPLLWRSLEITIQKCYDYEIMFAIPLYCGLKASNFTTRGGNNRGSQIFFLSSIVSAVEPLVQNSFQTPPKSFRVIDP